MCIVRICLTISRVPYIRFLRSGGGGRGRRGGRVRTRGARDALVQLVLERLEHLVSALPAVSGHLVERAGHAGRDVVQTTGDHAHHRYTVQVTVHGTGAGGQVTGGQAHGGAEAVEQLRAQFTDGQRNAAAGFHGQLHRLGRLRAEVHHRRTGVLHQRRQVFARLVDDAARFVGRRTDRRTRIGRPVTAADLRTNSVRVITKRVRLNYVWLGIGLVVME